MTITHFKTFGGSQYSSISGNANIRRFLLIPLESQKTNMLIPAALTVQVDNRDFSWELGSFFECRHVSSDRLEEPLLWSSRRAEAGNRKRKLLRESAL